MDEPLVVRFHDDALRDFERRAARGLARRGKAAIALAVLISALLLVPWVAANLSEGFVPRSLLLLLVLIVPVALVRWGRRTLLHRRPAVLGDIAFTVDGDEVHVAALPSTNSALGTAPAAVWPRSLTAVQVRTVPVVGEQLVLRGPGSQRRTYPVSALDTPPESVAARLLGR